MEQSDQTHAELLRLTRDNNRMLHAMRRNAFWGGVIKFILYALIFIAAPLWIYSSYLAPLMEQMLGTYQQIQGTSANVQTQFDDIENFLKRIQNGFSSQ